MFMEVCKREWKIKKTIFYSECSLNCGNNNGSRCLVTKIRHLPQICACSDGTYTNSTCPDVVKEENNVTSINIHGLYEWIFLWKDFIYVILLFFL